MKELEVREVENKLTAIFRSFDVPLGNTVDTGLLVRKRLTIDIVSDFLGELETKTGSSKELLDFSARYGLVKDSKLSLVLKSND